MISVTTTGHTGAAWPHLVVAGVVLPGAGPGHVGRGRADGRGQVAGGQRIDAAARAGAVHEGALQQVHWSWGRGGAWSFLKYSLYLNLTLSVCCFQALSFIIYFWKLKTKLQQQH